MRTERSVFLLEYVDNLVLTGNCTATVQDFVSKTLSKFEARVILKFENFLAVMMEKSNGKLRPHYKALIPKLLQKFKMLDCNSTKTPMVSETDSSYDGTDILSDHKMFQELVGSLFYILITSRLEISLEALYLSRLMRQPT